MVILGSNQSTRIRTKYPDPNKVSGSASLFGKSDPFSPGAVIECFKVALKGAGAVDSENELFSFLSVKHSLLLYVLASSSFYFDVFISQVLRNFRLKVMIIEIISYIRVII